MLLPGYDSAFIGKYLNGFTWSDPTPPGAAPAQAGPTAIDWDRSGRPAAAKVGGARAPIDGAERSPAAA